MTLILFGLASDPTAPPTTPSLCFCSVLRPRPPFHTAAALPHTHPQHHLTPCQYSLLGVIVAVVVVVLRELRTIQFRGGRMGL